MKLANLLLGLSDDELDRLALEHVGDEARPSRSQLMSLIEGTVRSYRFVQEFVLNRQPPSFAIFALLLNAEGNRLPSATFRDAVTAETERLERAIESGSMLRRHDGLRVYRRVLREARTHDIAFDVSESAMLNVLRSELDISRVEHFLVEHHAELRDFWKRENSFLHEMHALRSAGVVFAVEGDTVLPSDVAPLIRRALGIEAHPDAARRIFEHIPSSFLAAALERIDARTSGTKEERVARLLESWVQPSVVLRDLGIAELRDVCRDVGAAVGGAKEELVERIVEHFTAGLDRLEPPPPPAPPAPEPRVLDRDRFLSLFRSLRGDELKQMLDSLGLKSYGTKEERACVLWESSRSEQTLLGHLMNRDLEDVLRRNGLRLGGAKPERIERIVSLFRERDLELPATPDDAGTTD